MNELQIRTENDRITVSARELHQMLEVDTRFNDWMPRMVEYGFKENEDFYSNLSESTGGRQAIDYQITTDMAKEIAMIQRNEKGKEVRQYFINVEREWNTPEKIMARALRVAQSTIDSFNKKIALDKPKVEFFDQVTSSKNAIDMATCAKVLNISGFGRNNLFELLRNKKILQSNNVPYQKYVDQGYFRVIEQKYAKPDGTIQINIKTVVYQSGLDFIRRTIAKENEA